MSHVKGCEFHYLQSAKRLSKKRAMVPRDQAGRFMKLARKLLTKSAAVYTYNRAIEQLRNEFPLVTTAGRRKEKWSVC